MTQVPLDLSASHSEKAVRERIWPPVQRARIARFGLANLATLLEHSAATVGCFDLVRESMGQSLFTHFAVVLNWQAALVE